jgi:hypothetical protein
MFLLRLTSCLVIAAVTVACDSATMPLTDLNFAVVQGECGPADGPAVAIYLGTSPDITMYPGSPFVRIYIDRHVTELTERQWVVAGTGVNAAAWYHRGFDREAATAGVVNVTSVAPDNTIEGSADLTFPSGRVQRSFRAGWVPLNRPCV